MFKAATNVQEGLFAALCDMARSPDLTEAEVRWLNQFALHLIAEFSVLKSEEKKDKSTAATPS